MKKIIYSLLIAIGFITTVQAQSNWHQSLYMEHEAFMNPASMTQKTHLNGALFYKKQWVNIKNSPSFQGFSVVSPIMGLNNYAGLRVTNDVVGINHYTSIEGSYAYRFTFNKKSYLSLGLTAMVYLMQANYSELALQDANDEVFSEDTPTFVKPNFNFGALYSHPKFYVGFYTSKLLDNQINYSSGFQADTQFDLSKIQYNLHAGTTIKLANGFVILPSALFKQVSGAPLQIDVTTRVQYKKKIGIGVGYRSEQIAYGIFELRINDYIKLAYAYDYDFTDLKDFSSGSHEIMLIWDIPNEKNDVIVDSPRF